MIRTAAAIIRLFNLFLPNMATNIRWLNVERRAFFFFFSQKAERIKHLTTRQCVSHNIRFQYCCPDCPPPHPALVHLPRFKGLDRGLYFPWSHRPLNLALLWRPFFFPLRLTRKCTHLPDLEYRRDLTHIQSSEKQHEKLSSGAKFSESFRAVRPIPANCSKTLLWEVPPLWDSIRNSNTEMIWSSR